MPSRLSSLLVRDGLVGVKRMERAFQRQVIYGGTLDTILLEMSAVPEERLLQYLSLATGLPPATRSETERFDAEAVRVCDENVARQFQVAPLDYDGETLRVLVKEPVDFSVLEELADELGKPIQPMVVPEYRYHVVADRAYGRETDSRFVALLRRAEEERSPTPVGKAQTVIVDAADGSDSDHVVVDVGLPPATKPRRTLEMNTDSVRAAAARAASQTDSERGAAAPVETAAPAAKTAAPVPPAEAAPDAPAAANGTGNLVREVAAQAVDVRSMSPSDGVPRTVDPVSSGETTQPRAVQARGSMEISAQQPVEPRRPSRSIKVAAEARAEAPAPSRPPTGASTLVPQPISAAEAIDRLAAAESRDEIFAALVQAVRSRAWYAGIMTVQTGAVLGRVAIAGSEVDIDGISSVLIPLDAETAFRQAVTSSSPYIGPVATHDEQIDGMIRRMGGVVPPAALLMPVSLRNRVVALVIGHRGADSISVAEVSELLPLAGAAADAVSRLILSAKKAGYRPALETGPTPRFEPEEVPVKRAPEQRGNGAAAEKGEWTVPDTVKTPTLDFAAQPQPPERREPAADIDSLLDKVESDEDVDGRATAALMRQAPDAIERIGERFPGKLSVDRYELGGRALRAERHGALLGLVVKLGTASSNMLVERMSDNNRDVRYYATLCTGELRPRSALPALVDRLFDQDYGVRNAALAALSGYPARELEPALERARRLLHSDDKARCKAAAGALGELGDVASIPDLLDTVSRRDEAGEAARQALSQLTRQNFGSNARKWRAWWSKHKGQHRLEWLIEALAHKDSSLRSAAAEELRRITGEYFGFHHDMSKRERDEARKRWGRWWGETGRHRFVRQGFAEGDRRTELLPARRPPE